MDQLLVMYTCDDYNYEHKDEFYEYTGSYDAALTAEKLVVWEWPGSDRAKRILDYGSWIGENVNVRSNTFSDNGFLVEGICADYAYRDEAGREWGYVTITYTYSSWKKSSYIGDKSASMKAWVCLSDPQNSNIASFFPAPAPTEWVPNGSAEFTSKHSITILIPIIILLIILLFAVAFAIVVRVKVFRKRKEAGGR